MGCFGSTEGFCKTQKDDLCVGSCPGFASRRMWISESSMATGKLWTEDRKNWELPAPSDVAIGSIYVFVHVKVR